MMKLIHCSIPILLLSCASDNEVRLQKKELRTDFYTYDVSNTVVGAREKIVITGLSIGAAPVTIFDVIAEDAEHFVVLPSWKQEDSDQDGVLDALTVESGTEEIPTEAIFEVSFRPDAEEDYRTKLTILSNDSTTEEQTEDGYGIWRVALRGSGKYPCAEVFPPFYDFGPRAPGGYFAAEINIRNCGEANLTISSFNFAGSSSFFSATSTPIIIKGGEYEPIQIAWIPAGPNPESVVVSLVTNATNLQQEITLIGNSCEGSQDPKWDNDNDGWTSCGGDCDDTNPNINPSMGEIVNSRDDNCDGQIDEENTSSDDYDGDGFTEELGDCHDDNPNINPSAQESEEANYIDDNCNGVIDEGTDHFDDDGDGRSEREGDCDDTNENVFPLAPEIDNGIDDNCNGKIDEGFDSFDDDDDGFSEVEGDCDDNDQWTWPGAEEDCDEIDNDCDGFVDEGPDNEELGACAFLVEESTPNIIPPKSCQTVSSRPGLHFLFFMLGILLYRRS